MKLAKIIKSLGVAGVTSLTLMAGTSQAEPGYNPYFGNPWMAGPGYQQMQHRAAFRQQVAAFGQRLDNQLQRILQGIESDKLTKREAVGLLREHVAINNLERQYLADGRLGPNELRDLEQRLDRASKHIFFEAHDDDRRGGPDRPGYDGRGPGDGPRYR